MKKVFIFLFILMGCAIPSMASQQLEEANAKFTYHGRPIHPFLIGEFTGWLSDDRSPMITTVDVAAAFDSNKYPDDEVKGDKNYWSAERTEEDKGAGINLYESYGYTWLGKMADNVHVVELAENGGGSGTFMDLVFFKFSEGEIMREGKKNSQLLMTVVGTFSLGDRYEGEIKVYPDRVFIPASKNQYGGGAMEKDVVLSASAF